MNKFSINKLPSDSIIELANRHKNLRKKTNITQLELANRSGVSYGSVKRFENTGKISMESFLKLIYVLGRLSDMDKVLNLDSNSEKIEQLFSNKTRK